MIFCGLSGFIEASLTYNIDTVILCVCVCVCVCVCACACVCVCVCVKGCWEEEGEGGYLRFW